MFHLHIHWFLTIGSYLAPEFLMHGIVDEKTDVFAFGVLLLELVTGRRALDYSQQSLVLWVCHSFINCPLIFFDFLPTRMQAGMIMKN